MKNKDILLRIALLCIVSVLSASEVWAGDQTDYTMTVYGNPTGAGTVYAKGSADEDYESNSASVSSEESSYDFNVKYENVPSNYFWLGWSVDRVAESAADIKDTQNPTTIACTTDDPLKVVYANFTRVQVKSDNEAYGSVSMVSPYAVANDDYVILKATPKDGYKFDGWLLNDATDPVSTSGNYSFLVSDATAGIYTAVFSQGEDEEPVEGFNLIGICENGKVQFTVDGKEVSKAQEEQTVTVTVVPDTGWELASIEMKPNTDWDGAQSRRLRGGSIEIQQPITLTGSGNTRSFTMPANNVTVVVKLVRTIITITAASGEWTYDGTVHKNPAVTVTKGSLLDGDKLVAEAKGSVKKVADTREGNNTVKADYKVMRGTIDVTSSYTITTETGTLTVTPRPVTVSGIVARSRNYDGTTAVNLNISKAVLDGKVDGDDLSVTATGNFEDKNAGREKTVTISDLALDGADKDNYVLTEDCQTEATANINKRPVTVTARDKTISYGDEPANNGLRYLGFISGEDASVLLNAPVYAYNTAANGSGMAYTAGSPVGTYYIIPSRLRSDNYEFTYKTGVLTVKEKVYSYDDGTITQDQNGYTVTLDEGTGSADPLPIGDGSQVMLSYSRTLKAPVRGKGDKTVDGKAANLYTICLPFEPVTGEAVKYYTLSAVNGTVLDFEEVETPAAGTPYLVSVTGSVNFTESCADLDITSMAISSTTVGGYTLKGTYSGLSNADAQGLYILQDKGQWGMVTAANAKAYLPPFRAYIEGPADGARELGSSFGGESTGVTTLRTVDLDGTEHWYDLQGRRIAAPAKKGIFIYNGKKVTK